MSETLGLKNINMLSKEQYSGISDIAKDELYAISGSGFGFPSDRYDDLELGASGTEYVAPANGWFFLAKVVGTANGYVAMQNKTSHLGIQQSHATATHWIRANIEAQKGDIVNIEYNVTGATQAFRFIYAEGE